MTGAAASPYASAPVPRRALAPAAAVSLGVHAVALAAALWWRFDGGPAVPPGFVVEVAFLETGPGVDSATPSTVTPEAAGPHVAVPPPADAAPEPPSVDSLSVAVTPVNETAIEPEAAPAPEPAREAVALPLPTPPRPRPPAPTETPSPAVEPAPQPARAPAAPAQLASAAPLSDITASAAEATDVARAPAPSADAVASAPASILPAVVTNPRFRRSPVPPAYPRRALDLGQEGEVIVRALVGADGESRDIRLWRSSGVAALDEAALRAVRRWAFEAARVDGRPIEAWVEVPVRFHLRSIL